MYIAHPTHPMQKLDLFTYLSITCAICMVELADQPVVTAVSPRRP